MEDDVGSRHDGASSLVAQGCAAAGCGDPTHGSENGDRLFVTRFDQHDVRSNSGECVNLAALVLSNCVSNRFPLGSQAENIAICSLKNHPAREA
jgi:hypothetical protein